jgi:outer membrane immunogenic protein
MKHLFLTGASLFVLTSAAMAADVPPYEAPMAVSVEHNWSGAYVGIHGGYAWGDQDLGAAELTDELEGFVIGGQVGYNWQWDSIVFGIEADGSYSDQEDEIGGLVSTEVEYLASVRGRVGWAFDRFLVYGTGGAAFAGNEFELIGLDEDDADFFGWAAGGGVEYMVTDNISIGVEYLHYEFDDEEIELGGIVADADLTTDVVRGRVSIKFESLFN